MLSSGRNVVDGEMELPRRVCILVVDGAVCDFETRGLCEVFLGERSENWGTWVGCRD